MKLSVSLADDSVAFLDRFARERGIASRSAALQAAVEALMAAELGPAYAEAWDEWAAGDEAGLWDRTVADGLGG